MCRQQRTSSDPRADPIAPEELAPLAFVRYSVIGEPESLYILAKKAALLRIARAISARDVERVSEWFTEDFKLHDPSLGGFRAGHAGARDLLRSLAEHVLNARVDALDMVEEGDKVAVRWLFSGETNG